MKLFYYLQRFGYQHLPSIYFKQKYKFLKKLETKIDKEELNSRLNYYVKTNTTFRLPPEAIAIKDFKRKGNSSNYFLDLKDFLHYFNPEARLLYRFGDNTETPQYPTLVKARIIDNNNANSVLFKLNKVRHFKWVNDPYTFEQKKNMLVWRGGAYQTLRKKFVKSYWNHPLCDVGQTNTPKENAPWQKPFLPIKKQLEYKFILCLEGNDVASNLKWAMSSNSLCFMTKPHYETWFMEGTLKKGIHYVEIKNDFSNLEEKLLYYTQHTEEAKTIINNAHNYIKKFQNNYIEDLLCLKVLEKYMELSKQSNFIKFE